MCAADVRLCLWLAPSPADVQRSSQLCEQQRLLPIRESSSPSAVPVPEERERVSEQDEVGMRHDSAPACRTHARWKCYIG